MDSETKKINKNKRKRQNSQRVFPSAGVKNSNDLETSTTKVDPKANHTKSNKRKRRNFQKISPSSTETNSSDSHLSSVDPQYRSVSCVYEDRGRKYSMAFWKLNPYNNGILYYKVQIIDYFHISKDYNRLFFDGQKDYLLVQNWGLLGTQDFRDTSEKLPLECCINRFYYLINCYQQYEHYLPLIDSPETNEVNLSFPVQKLIKFIYSNNMIAKNDLNNNSLVDCYKKLNSNISVLDRNSVMFDIIQQYITNTHSEFHYHFRVMINDVFMVDRYGEDDNYMRNLHNKKLLWHGTKMSNICAILSNGLKISPLNAKHTGHMFGKGIYFTNVVSKAANYSKTNVGQGDHQGILLLCEVALGNVMELYNATNITQLPSDVHSVFVRGISSPQNYINISQGVEVPYGPLVNVPLSQIPQFRHNQFVIYNTAQVRIRYLVCVSYDCLS
ncbi:poly [ADP-ribose] polymerase-like [Microplitis mediator]|uniref:poly [ADP-ribose] polymerase-like n=1 Tax=Microplitis mediator TaxID=375433 RepID=UPI002555F2E3|nr:poly [ADP-ribose] polymerase-like [Microplitis mediator]XP_057341275.1 poly [ADP-ribose] polymerase-like [Microplitis mediator]